MIDVSDINAHAVPLVIQAREVSKVVESSFPIVAVEFVGLVGVVRQVKILIAVVVVVEENAAHSHSGVERACLGVDIDKSFTSLVFVEMVHAIDVDHIEVCEPSLS